MATLTLSQDQVKKVLTYGKQMQISQLGLSLIITRLKGMYAEQPLEIAKYTADLNNFFAKYAIIMQKDYDYLIKI